MYKNGMLGKRICPKCGHEYTGAPAISREDNKTQICQDCGTREALASMGVGEGEQERILETIHRNEARNEGP